MLNINKKNTSGRDNKEQNLEGKSEKVAAKENLK